MTDMTDETTEQSRSTFLQGDQILVRTQTLLQQAGELLEQMRRSESDERARLFAEGVERQRKHLVDALDEYLRDAPSSVLDHFAQYSAEVTAEPAPPPEPLEIAETTRWIVSISERLEMLFDGLAGQAANQEAKEAFSNLAALVRASSRRIAEQASTVEDL